MHVRHPVLLSAAGRSGAGTFALLFSLESVARASIATVIPLQAFALLESTRAVSLTYTCVGIGGLIGSLFIPLLIRVVPRRWVYTIGGTGLIGAATLFAIDGLGGLVGGLFLRVLATACLNVTLNLYILDNIPRGDLVRSEPLRLAVSGIAWTLCPSLGVILYSRYGVAAADGLSAAAALALLATFWVIRVSDNPAISAARTRPPDPLRNIGRFFGQPRLRLGWLIAFGRSSWWAHFFTFAPLYMVTAGHSEVESALLVSLGNAAILLNVLVGRIAARIGVRRVIIASYLVAGSASLAAASLVPIGPSLAVAALLLVGSLGAANLDAVGNIPFLRAVRPLERAQMASVFRTYIDMSELLPPAVFAALLSVFGLESVFAAAGVLMLAIALVARSLPRGL